MPFLINRKVSVACCTVGVLEVLIGTVLVVCGFIQMGVYYNKSAIGLWAGFPLLVPGLLGIVVLATRHKSSAIFFTICNVIVLVLCVAHAVVSYDDTDTWDKFRDLVDANQCYERLDKCICTATQNDYFVRRCNLYEFGYELFWSMMGFSCAGGLLTVFGVLAGALGAFQQGEKEEYEAPPRDAQYDNRRRYDYYVDN